MARKKSDPNSLDMSQLSDRQRRILQVIQDAVVLRGYPPSIREIGDAAGLQYLLLAFALMAAGALFVASVELPHEVRTMARWRKEAVRSWRRQPFAILIDMKSESRLCLNG